MRILISNIVKVLIICLSILFSQNKSNAQWVQCSGLPSEYAVQSLCVSNNYILAGTDGGIYRSGNSGANWTLMNNLCCFFSLASLPGNLVLAGTSGGIWRSTTNGLDWNFMAYSGYQIYAIINTGSYSFAGSWGDGAFKSTDTGLNWTYVNLPTFYIYSLGSRNNYIFAGTSDSGICVSTNNGNTWSRTSYYNNAYGFAANNTEMYAAAYNGIIKTTSNGSLWTQTSLQRYTIRSVFAYDNNIFAGSSDSGIYFSTNAGANWIKRNEGLAANNLNIHAINLINSYVIIGTNRGLWRRPFYDFTGIRQSNTETPVTYSLVQNYPNPFNPTTNIEFSVPKKSFVKITIYNALGKTVDELVNFELDAGTYNVDWQAGNFASGVYYYQLTAESYCETRRMVLIK